MFTRRSWRNQNRLFKALFKPEDIKPLTLDQRIANAEARIADPGTFSRERKQWERELAGLKRRKSRDTLLASK